MKTKPSEVGHQNQCDFSCLASDVKMNIHNEKPKADFMMKLHDLIAQLQEQEKKYGDIEISVGVLPVFDQPKEGQSRYLQVFGPWYVNAQEKQKLSFRFNEDKQCGNWLEITFENGQLRGEFAVLDREELQYHANKDEKIDARKPKY